MALSNSILAYADCSEFLERALDAERGARIPFLAETEARYWRMRCNQFRTLHREQNRQIHEIGTKMHGVSEYDELTMTIKQSSDGYFWVYAQKRTIRAGDIEEIPIEEAPLQITQDEIRMLEDHSDDDQTPA
jgi:hypothetical protein